MENYHTHTWRCGHASGTVGDYAREAVKAGISVLGITDHAPLPDDRWGSVRMGMEEADAYEAEIEAARADCPSLRILYGYECEYHPDYRAYYAEELLGRRGCRYLVGAAHWVPVDGAWVGMGELNAPGRLRAYARYVAESMASGLFAFFAHPDVFGAGYPEWDRHAADCAREILAAAAAHGVPLEINGYGLRKPGIATRAGVRPMYPWLPFWELAANFDVRVVCNSDAHRPEDVAASIPEAEAIAERFGLPRARLGLA